MSINLIESERVSHKSIGGTLLSIALHAGVITLAVYTTARAGNPVVTRTPQDTVVFYPPQPEPPGRMHDAPSHPSDPSTPAPPREPVFMAPIEIPDKLPAIDSSTNTIPDEPLFSTGRGGNDVRGTGSTTDGESGQPLFASQVEIPAVPRDGNPMPTYPSLLESSRIEGRVLVEFVVDTLGNADMNSFRVLESSNELFARSLRATLPKWRFYSAEAGGRKVKQVVQLPLRFVAPRRRSITR